MTTAESEDRPIAETPLGRIRGHERDGCCEFRGIRFARAPVGDLRFRPPVPVDPWSDVYDATRFGPSAPQPLMFQPDDPLPLPVEPTDEDCLFLNVYTPAVDGAQRPVLFWIHGGGYVVGSGRVYDGRVFAREHDVVVVTVNYRMGPLGFMHVGHLDPELSESVNTGILDQICALEWTRDNIGAFGGDPHNVLIFGESAGGTSTAMLLGCPSAEGLFHKAVVHSPHVDLIPVGRGHVDFTNDLIRRLGGDPARDGLDTLRRASVEELIALFALEEPSAVPEPNLAVRRQDNVTYSPAIDGNLIPAAVADTVRERGERNVPFLGGGCRHEGTLFPQILGTSDFSAGEAGALFEREGVNGARALEVYEKFAPGSTPREKLVYALTDTMFRNSMVRILDAAAESGGRCWSWLCTWETDHAGGELRASHAMELPFLWDWANNPDAGPLSAYAGSNAPKELGRAMREYWVRFARTGTPSAAGEPEWPQYSVPERPVLILDAERRVEQSFDDEVRELWFTT